MNKMFLDEHTTLENKIKLNVLNEDYFGKKPNIKKIEKAVRKFQENGGNPNNNSKAIKMLNEAIMDEFNFKKSNIHFVNIPILNAMTIPARGMFKNPIRFIKGSTSGIDVNNNGIRFKDKYNYKFSMYIFTPLIMTLTPEQVTGVILHEIGHNFQSNKGQGILFLTQALQEILNIGLIVFLKSFGKDIVKGFGQLEIIKQLDGVLHDLFKRGNKDKKAISEGFFSFKLLNYIMLVTAIVSNKVKLSFKSAFNISDMLFNFAFSFLGATTSYENEVTSDSFASMFGYGAETIKGLEEMEMIMSVTEEDKVEAFKDQLERDGLTNMFYSIDTYFTTIMSFTEPHPSTFKRAEEQIKFLNRELGKNTLSKEEKENIKDQIKLLETVTKDGFRSKMPKVNSTALKILEKLKAIITNPRGKESKFNDLKSYLGLKD